MKKTALFLCLAISALTLTNCAKKGCMDSDATDYDSNAKKDDGSCTYGATVTFWYNQATSTSMTRPSGYLGYPISTMTYYVNGKVIGSSAATVYNTSEPSCSGGAAHSSFSLGSAKTVTYPYYVVVDAPTGSYNGGEVIIYVSDCIY
jgi:hypothetical protein